MNKVLNETPPALTVTPSDQAAGPFVELLQGLLKKKASERISDPDELTWLLKQAEMNYLQASRASHAIAKNVPVSRTQEARTTEPTARVPELSREAPAVIVPASQSSSRTGPAVSWKLMALAMLIIFGGVALYFAVTGSKSTLGTQISIGDKKVAETPLQAATQADTMAQHELEQAQRREMLRQEALTAAKTLSVEANDFRVGLFGGIKNVQLTLSNPSEVQFTSVTVRVTYYKDNGGLYKSENVIFRNVGPGSSSVRNAPNSDRGVSIKYKITGYESPALINPDSVLVNEPIAPLN
jgi:serine/threonine-protein kinase